MSSQITDKNAPDTGADLKSTSHKAPTELFSLIKQKRWSDVISRADAIPNEAATWIIEQKPDGTVHSKTLPIHSACQLHPTEAAIKSLIRAFPRATRITDAKGNLPLHLACRDRASASAVRALLGRYTDGAKVTDGEGRLPLHMACRQWAEVETISNLLVAYYHGAQCPDSYGLLPLHWACAQNASVAVVEALLRAYPESVNVKDKWGRTPKALAETSTASQRNLIMEALSRDSTHWATELIDEVTSLKTELKKKFESEKQITNKAETLESKLMEVTVSSSAAAKSFRDLKDALVAENKNLKKVNASLLEQNEEQEERIEELSEENSAYKKNLDEMTAKFDRLSELIRDMEEQRHLMLSVTGKWETIIKKAQQNVVDCVDMDVTNTQVLLGK
eukprot:CAMPEP_0172492948 /NCGR_PEP_ID=MMETSP1066-20121228/24245_1 /TAXON_ID=671091 /ORGANISM="Coscinodiscus wailesii, Strain CCMP2513" /LENGTH=391 /DNA_ID=CAMNT_0013262849 /DNA_START=97 /DNA_END=1272 /DNA_ORIENTATION=+